LKLHNHCKNPACSIPTCGDRLAIGWIVGGLSPKIKPTISGLTATFILKGSYKLHSDAPPSGWEGKIPASVTGDVMIKGDPKMGLGYASDFAPFKPVADFTAVGTAYPPKVVSESFPVIMRVGSKLKELKVFGPWKWLPLASGGEMPGPSGPLIPVPITYANAWGGPEYALNPLGCGREGEKTPLLEIPDAYISSRNFTGGPAVFAPMPSDAPYRKSKMGTYDKVWIEERWPWLPADFDYSYYNAAHPSQWMEGYLRGDEELEFVNMHPTVSRYQSRLPGLRARCFVTRITNWSLDLNPEEAEREFHEIPVDLDTLWVDMDEEKLVLVWRGRTPVKSLKRRDLESMLVLTEPLDAPDLGLAYYQRLLETELAKRPQEFSAKKPLDPEDFITKELAKKKTAPGFTNPEGIEKKKEEGLAKKTAALDEFSHWESDAKDKKAKAIAEMDQKYQEQLSNLSKFQLGKHPEVQKALQSLPPSLTELTKNNLADKNQPQNPKAQLNGSFVELKQQIKKSLEDPRVNKDAKNNLQNILFQIDDTEKKSTDLIIEAEETKKEADKKVAEARKQALLESLPLKPCAVMQKGEVIDCDKIKLKGLANTVITGVDFSGLDLTSVDFSNSKIIECQFRGTKLLKADFSKALIDKSDLSDADFSDANLEGSLVHKSDVSGTLWKGALLNKAKLMMLKFGPADFSKTKGELTSFVGSELEGADFSDAILINAQFISARLEKANFSRTVLTGSNFSGVRAAGILMDDATMSKVSAINAADFTGGMFRRIRGIESVWDTSILDNADFHQAILNKARFSESLLRDTHFDRCDLREGVFDDAALQRAILTNTNLFQAIFSRANLTGARFDGSNLYGANFWESDRNYADFSGANLKRAMFNNQVI